MKKNKYYVVWLGRNPGIYSSWEDCERETAGVKGAKYKSFGNRLAAEAAFREGPEAYWGKKSNEMPLMFDLSTAEVRPVSPFIAVDAACSGNPGKMEYQGVFVDFGQKPAAKVQLFKSPVFENGTNNIGEFLAIVHALAWQKQKHFSYPIYSDSVNAQLWIKQKQCKTKLPPNDKNAYLFELIQRAENWLKNNTIKVPILKWKTEIWGEIPADFGRK